MLPVSCSSQSVARMPLEVLGPLAVLTAGMKALPGAALLKTSGAAVAAKGTGIFAAKNKAVFAATHPGTSSGTSASHEALEKAKTELQKAASDIEEAENTTKSMMPIGLLTAFGFGGKQDDTVAALRRARARSHHGDDRRVRLSTVPDRCSSYGDFL
ncbi:hypothetical protein TGRUB_215530 [Toxoplasma gondii RUB]|uniref:Uncharacterized protein n=1 Tax=Toxoplasma gondii RUB TaxID=935652 RepID=A0A086LZS2_TOXGO|nr:hypothetical protein TGRUB_215530 [Toxoplasma gondii RUB]